MVTLSPLFPTIYRRQGSVQFFFFFFEKPLDTASGIPLGSRMMLSPITLARLVVIFSLA